MLKFETSIADGTDEFQSDIVLRVRIWVGALRHAGLTESTNHINHWAKSIVINNLAIENYFYLNRPRYSFAKKLFTKGFGVWGLGFGVWG